MRKPPIRVRGSHGTEEFDHGIIVIVDGLAWGPFEQPDHALAFALKFRPDNLFKLMHLVSPDIIDALIE